MSKANAAAGEPEGAVRGKGRGARKAPLPTGSREAEQVESAAVREAVREATRKAARALKLATDRANAHEEQTKTLLEQLSVSEANVKMLRSQLRKQQPQQQPPHSEDRQMPPAARSLGSSLAKPGRRYEPRRLPRIEHSADPEAADPAAAPMPAKRAGKPEWDVRGLDDWSTNAFPNYGGKSRTGLKAMRRPVNA